MSGRHAITGHGHGCCCRRCDEIPMRPTEAAERVRTLEAAAAAVITDLEALARDWQRAADAERGRYPDLAARRDADRAQLMAAVARARRAAA